MLETLKDESCCLINIIISIILGFSIGFERKLRSKEAGIRTHTVVCFGSALFVVVSKFGFGENFDSARVAAQVVSGVGFLGAGMIMFRQREIHGLTTAAGIWATAGIGMASGAGLYIVSIGATILLIGVQCFLHSNINFFTSKKVYFIKIRFSYDEKVMDNIKEMFKIVKFDCFDVKEENGETMCTASFSTIREVNELDLIELKKVRIKLNPSCYLEENKYIPQLVKNCFPKA